MFLGLMNRESSEQWRLDIWVT